MEKDLFEIFPDLPSPRRMRPPVRQIVSSVEPSPLPTSTIARRRVLRLNIDDEALRRIRKIAQAESERLKSTDRVAQKLRTIVAIADAAIFATSYRLR
jgi:hypothetical protein